MAELKEYSLETIQKHNNADSCWLVVNNCVYDATKFLDLHPGGDTIVLEYAGTDCTAAFETDVHNHSQSAHVMLKDYLIGYVEGTGASQKKKNAEASSENAELVDFKKAVLPQIMSLGPKYQPWVHTTSTTKMRIFEWDFFEAFSYHPWWYIFFVWIPVISFLIYESLEKGNTYVICFFCFLVGMAAWTLVEYLIHRFIFHFDSATPMGNFVHFFLHGAHHLTPMEPSRLTFPPTFAPPVGILLYHFFSYFFPAHLYQAVFAGGAFMYMMYDTMHYYFHHGDCFNIGYLKEMKKRHLSHHFKDDLKNFGVTNPFWDIVFGTNGPEWSLSDSNPLEKEVK